MELLGGIADCGQVPLVDAQVTLRAVPFGSWFSSHADERRSAAWVLSCSHSSHGMHGYLASIATFRYVPFSTFCPTGMSVTGEADVNLATG
jgi:hypothetical protein